MVKIGEESGKGNAYFRTVVQIAALSVVPAVFNLCCRILVWRTIRQRPMGFDVFRVSALSVCRVWRKVGLGDRVL